MNAKSFRTIAALLIFLSALNSQLSTASAQVPQLLHYQGRAIVSNTNFEGTGQFKFALVRVAGVVTFNFWSNDGSVGFFGGEPTASVAIPVTKGLYSVLLGDTTLPNMTAIPASVFTNSIVSLRVWFNDGTHGFQLVSPDQRIAAVGYAMMAASVDDGAITSAKLASGAAAANLAAGNTINANLSFIGGGYLNYAGADNSVVVGGEQNTNSGLYSFIGGGHQNTVLGTESVIAGGNRNLNSSDDSAIVGGVRNSITPDGDNAFIGAGAANTNAGRFSSIVGGERNTITLGSEYSFIGGGQNNTSSALYATVPGGQRNAAAGAHSFAAGQRAKALHQGSFVWADSTFGDFSSVADNEFAIRAAGGVRVVGGGVTASSFNGPGTLLWQEVTATTQQADSHKGYLANSALEVTITLPPSPTVGDVVRVSGVGAGGWKIAQNSGQYIRATSIGSAYSRWTARESNRYWRAIASSADGNKLVAVDHELNPTFNGKIYTSTDAGLNWSASGSDYLCNAVASSADGSKLVACSTVLLTSTDSGLTWIERGFVANNWRGVASSEDGSKLVAVRGVGQIYTSTDSGINWVARASSENWRAVASSADGSKLVAVVSGGQIYTSTDSGVNWTPHESIRNWICVASSADGNKLVAVVQLGQIYTSTDAGVNWTQHENNRYWSSVASSADGSKLVAVVGQPGASEIGQAYTSTDSGFSWTPRDSSRNWSGVASSADGSKLVAVAYGGQIYTSAAVTALGTAGYLAGDADSAIELQYVGGGQFRVLSHAGTITSY